mgnify:CR=1 FL=1
MPRLGPPQVVHVYTFNDGVLVAQELKAAQATGKHKGAPAASLAAPQRLVVEQWLPLASVAPVNLRDTEGARGPTCIGWAAPTSDARPPLTTAALGFAGAGW